MVRQKCAESAPFRGQNGAIRPLRRSSRQDRCFSAGDIGAKPRFSIAQGVHICLCILATLAELRFPNIEDKAPGIALFRPLRNTTGLFSNRASRQASRSRTPRSSPGVPLSQL